MDTNFWIFSSIALITTIITTIVIAIKNQKYKKRADELLGELVEIR